ncbi:MAG: glycosyl transferase family 1 [Dehalococcoidia bacterium]|nr:MAG: glycosyl transferase family 1 [Dehalococcoidia bacterium]
MLETVDVGVQCIDCYEASAGAAPVAQLRALAAPLRGARVLHLNATPYGGGVAEILRSEIPLLRDLGLAADWKLITGDEAFFSVTKAMHNGLQGAGRELTAAEQETYLANATRNARLLEEQYDLIIVHDPQPLALLELHGKGAAQWIWRCHIDTSEPNPQVWGFLRPYLVGYDAAVFTLGGFVPPDFPVGRVEIIPPAIDPESPKNIELGAGLARRVLQWIGVEVDKPLVTQVSRFDPWKDPLGVIAAYRLVKAEVPDLQLALVGSMALDDPEGWDVYRQIRDAARLDPSIHLFTNLTGVGNVEVNAFQRLSDVVIQKSLREGFGLVVSETLWKGTPVVAGRAGGIPLQLQGAAGGFLVDSVEACAERTLWLLRHPDHGRALAERGRDLVRERFLLTRLIADELRLYGSLLGTPSVAAAPAAKVGLAGELRDPVCGMQLDPSTALAIEHQGRRYAFCSEACRQQFTGAPERFLRAVAAAPRSGE